MRVLSLPILIVALLLLGCGPQPNQGSSAGSAAPVPEAPQSPEASAQATAERPTALPSQTDTGVRTPELPPRITEMAPLQDDGFPVSDPPLREEIFPPGERGGRIISTLFSDPTGFNMITTSGLETQIILGLTEASLLSYNNYSQSVEPGLAHAWEHDEAGTTWTFHLREGLTFSDGSPITSENFARFLRVIYTEGLSNSKGDIMRVDGEPFTWETPDPLTLVVHTPGVFSGMELQASGGFIPLPQEPWETALQSADPAEAISGLFPLSADPSTLVSSGPFMLTSFRSGEEVRLRRNPHFAMWDADGQRLPYLDEVIYLIVPDQNGMRLAFEAGNSDVLNPIKAEHYVAMRDGAAEGNYTVWDLGPSLSRSFFWFNLNDGINPDTGEPFVPLHKQAWFQSVEFRRAISHAIDRETMVDIVLAGRGVPSLTYEPVSNLFWHNPDVPTYPYDPARAGEILQSLGMIDRDGDGVREDAEGNPLRFTMVSNQGNDQRERLMELVRQDLQLIGIQMDTNVMDFAALLNRINDTHDYEACMLGLGGGTPDPTTGFNVLRSSGRLHLWYPQQETPATEAEARIDVLCDAILNTLDREEQRTLYNEVQHLLSEMCFVISTINPNVYIATRNTHANWSPAIVDDRALWNITSLWRTTP